MKVLHIIDSLAMGGAEVLLTQMHSGFERRGIACEYYLLRTDDSSHPERVMRGMGPRIFSPSGLHLYSPLQAKALADHLPTHRYDVVHVHLFPAQLWVPLAMRFARCTVPMITTEHSTHNRRRKALLRPLERCMYSQYAHVACISEAVRNELVRWVPSIEQRTSVCPNGVELQTFANARRTPKREWLGTSEEKPVVIIVGRLTHNKNHAVLIRATSQISALHVAIVGSGAMENSLKSLASQLNISDRIHFLGPRTDIPRLLKSSDIYVQCSRWEGFGIAAVEAMAAGLPIIASRVPGLADVVGDAALHFAPDDHLALAQCLRTLLASSSLRREMSAASQARAQNFSLERTLDCYESLYRRLSDSPVVEHLDTVPNTLAVEP